MSAGCATWRACRLAVTALFSAALLASAAGAAETNLKFTLDRKFEGPAAPFLLPLDQGYYKAEGLNVSFDPAANVLEAIKRVASGEYEMGFADINAMIKYRDANPKTPVKAVFMVYNRPPFAVIARKSRGISAPKDLEGHKLGAPADSGSFSLWPIFVKANGIDAAKVTIESIGFQVRNPMLAAGQVDAITGLSFSSYIDLKDKGVPADDIVVMLMADYGITLYGGAIIVNPAFADAHPDAVRGFLRAYLRGLKKTIAAPASALEYVLERVELRPQESRARSPENGDPREHRHPGSEGKRLWRRRRRTLCARHRPARAKLRVQAKAEAERNFRRVVLAAGERAQSQLALSRRAPATWRGGLRLSRADVLRAQCLDNLVGQLLVGRMAAFADVNAAVEVVQLRQRRVVPGHHAEFIGAPADDRHDAEPGNDRARRTHHARTGIDLFPVELGPFQGLHGELVIDATLAKGNQRHRPVALNSVVRPRTQTVSSGQ